MTDELIKRLHSIWIGPGSKQAACEEAVVLIEQQSARIAELEASLQASRRAALEECAKACEELESRISEAMEAAHKREGGPIDGGYLNACDDCAEAIRALSGPTET